MEPLWIVNLQFLRLAYSDDMPTPTHIAQRLRHIRRQQNLTLKQIEIRSRGKWKAVVIGSYERGVRSLSLAKAQELCEFYGVPMSALLDEPDVTTVNPPLILDIRKVRAQIENPDRFAHQIYDVLHWISAVRQDWNGEVMTLRKSDIDTLMIVTRKTASELHASLANREFYFTKLNQV
jgi:transcriptional regulator with XRE-family HTH domain